MTPPATAIPNPGPKPDPHPLCRVLGAVAGFAFTTALFFVVLNAGRWLDPRLPPWTCGLLVLAWALAGKAVQKALR